MEALPDFNAVKDYSAFLKAISRMQVEIVSQLLQLVKTPANFAAAWLQFNVVKD